MTDMQSHGSTQASSSETWKWKNHVFVGSDNVTTLSWSTSITREAYMKLKAKDQASATKAHFTTAQIPYSVADFRRERKRDEKPGISPSPTCIRHLFEKHAKEKYDDNALFHISRTSKQAHDLVFTSGSIATGLARAPETGRVEANLSSTGTAAAAKSIYDGEGKLAMTFLLELGPTEEYEEVDGEGYVEEITDSGSDADANPASDEEPDPDANRATDEESDDYTAKWFPQRRGAR